MRKVKVTYFKDTGKYYDQTIEEVDESLHFFQIIEELRIRLFRDSTFNNILIEENDPNDPVLLPHLMMRREGEGEIYLMRELKEWLDYFLFMCHEHGIDWQWSFDILAYHYQVVLRYGDLRAHFTFGCNSELADVQEKAVKCITNLGMATIVKTGIEAESELNEHGHRIREWLSRQRPKQFLPSSVPDGRSNMRVDGRVSPIPEVQES